MKEAIRLTMKTASHARSRAVLAPRKPSVARSVARSRLPKPRRAGSVTVVMSEASSSVASHHVRSQPSGWISGSRAAPHQRTAETSGSGRLRSISGSGSGSARAAARGTSAGGRGRRPSVIGLSMCPSPSSSLSSSPALSSSLPSFSSPSSAMRPSSPCVISPSPSNCSGEGATVDVQRANEHERGPSGGDGGGCGGGGSAGPGLHPPPTSKAAPPSASASESVSASESMPPTPLALSAASRCVSAAATSSLGCCTCAAVRQPIAARIDAVAAPPPLRCGDTTCAVAALIATKLFLECGSEPSGLCVGRSGKNSACAAGK
eukprot:scaffold132538_cov69-Phaeocystis_antarctica.AAC.8